MRERARQTLLEAAHNGKDIDALVQEVRHNASASIQQRCALMRLLDMPQPITLDKEGLNVLLKKWDAKRNIEREQIVTFRSTVNRLAKLALVRQLGSRFDLRVEQLDQWFEPG